MEIFCILLQCRVNLSMFHSSSTYKIWHTSIQHDVHYNDTKPQNCIMKNFVPRAVKVCCPFRAQWKKTFLSTLYVIISQSVQSTFTKLFAHFFIWDSWARNGKFGAFFEKNTLGPSGFKKRLPWMLCKQKILNTLNVNKLLFHSLLFWHL
jgi:hypothetical protein